MKSIEQPASAPVESTRSKIVVGVDDIPENLAMLKAYVTAAGFMFFGARSGEECMALTARVVPRLILLDIEMAPGIDGLETCRRLRRSRELKHVPIAFLTAHKSANDVMAGIAAGGNDFIAKPFQREQLLQRINHWMSRRI
jgi:two-component system OmpR family response regulator